MPHSKSAKKRMRQATRRRAANRTKRSALRTLVKRVRTAEKREDAEKAYREAEQLLDRAAGNRLIHPNLAARTKSRLRKAIAEKS